MTAGLLTNEAQGSVSRPKSVACLYMELASSKLPRVSALEWRRSETNWS
jgi:hypothetical protein